MLRYGEYAWETGFLHFGRRGSVLADELVGESREEIIVWDPRQIDVEEHDQI